MGNSDSPRSVERDHRQTASLTNEAIDCCSMRRVERFARETVLEWRQLLVCFSSKLGERGRIALKTSRGDEVCIDRFQSIDELPACVAAKALGFSAMAVQFPDDHIEELVEPSIGAAAKRREPRDDALEM